jgi:V-ATPase subunit C
LQPDLKLGNLICPRQTGTLELLVALSEDLPKQDAFFTATVAKTVDTLRNLLNNDPAKLAQHILVDEKTVDDYLLKGWKWNEGRYGVQKSLREIADTFNKVSCLSLLRSNYLHLPLGNGLDRQRYEG